MRFSIPKHKQNVKVLMAKPVLVCKIIIKGADYETGGRNKGQETNIPC